MLSRGDNAVLCLKGNNAVLCLIAGYLTGSENYYSHYRCDGKNMCGFDLRDNSNPTWANGTYSTHLFAEKVIDIVKNHKEDKVYCNYTDLCSVFEFANFAVDYFPRNKIQAKIKILGPNYTELDQLCEEAPRL